MMDVVSAPPMLGGAGSLLAGLAGLILPSLVMVTLLFLSKFLLLTALFLAELLAGFLARPLVELFWAVFFCAGLLAGFVLTMMFVVGGVFLLPVAGV